MAANSDEMGPVPTAQADDSIRLLGQFFCICSVVLFWVYRGALQGEFFSDDSFYIVDLANNHSLDLNFVAKSLDPTGNLKFEIMNYAPLYLLTSRIESAIFGGNLYGYHVVNVLFHALNATLVVALARAVKISDSWAFIAGAFFALHPANVEAVAWISQLRSILALGCAMGSLLALRRYPGLAAGLFLAGLLFKVSALFALPVALVLAWFARKDPQQEPISWGWLGIWCVFFALYAYPQFISFEAFGESRAPGFADAPEQMRSMAAIGTRYLFMAATSGGVSAYHEPEPVHSWLDPWWLASLPIGVVLLWRIYRGFENHTAESAHWIGAAFAFGPISQIFPFYYGMGDRYLYFILPGLILATLLVCKEFANTPLPRLPGLESRWHGLTRLEWCGRIGVVLLIATFAARSTQRAGLWHDAHRLQLEAAENYPEGSNAHWLQTMRALSRGEIDEGLDAYEQVIESGYFRLNSLFEIPRFAYLHQHPKFVALRRRLAQLELDDIAERDTPTQREFRHAGSAHFYLGDYKAALAMFESALRMDGPYRQELLGDREVTLEMIRRAKARALPAGTPSGP